MTRESSQRPPSEEQRALTDAMVQVSFGVMSRLTQLGSAHELSLTQVRVLAILRDHEPRMAELATHLGLDRSTISGLVDRAARRGLVERETTTEDRRSSRVRLTDAGRELADALGDAMAEVTAHLTQGLSRTEQRSLRTSLERLLEQSSPPRHESS